MTLTFREQYVIHIVYVQVPVNPGRFFFQNKIEKKNHNVAFHLTSLTSLSVFVK